MVKSDSCWFTFGLLFPLIQRIYSRRIPTYSPPPFNLVWDFIDRIRGKGKVQGEHTRSKD